MDAVRGEETPPPGRRGRGRPRVVEFDDMVRAGSEVVRTFGAEGLTMRSVANRLGVSPGALYNHVPNRRALLEAVAAAVMPASPPAIEADDWRDWLRLYARAIRSQVIDAGDVAIAVAVASEPAPEGMVRLSGDGYERLRATGFDERSATLGLHLVGMVAWASARDELIAASSPGGRHPRQAQVDRLLASGGLPEALADAAAGPWSDYEGRFEFDLDCVIAGLESRGTGTGTGGAR